MRDAVGLLRAVTRRRRDCEDCLPTRHIDCEGDRKDVKEKSATHPEVYDDGATKTDGKVGVAAAAATAAPDCLKINASAAADDDVVGVGEWLAWSLPSEVSDGDITEMLSALPTHAALEDCGNPTGSVFGAHEEGKPPRAVDHFFASGRGGRSRRRGGCFCFFPIPLFWVIAATVCCVVVLVC